MGADSDDDRWSHVGGSLAPDPEDGLEGSQSGWSPSASPIHSPAAAQHSDSDSWGRPSGEEDEQGAAASRERPPSPPQPVEVQPLVVRRGCGRPRKAYAAPPDSTQPGEKPSAPVTRDLAVDGLVALDSKRNVGRGGLLQGLENRHPWPWPWPMLSKRLADPAHRQMKRLQRLRLQSWERRLSC